MLRFVLTVLFSASLLVAPAWSTTTSTLRRGLSDDSQKKCPANQQYLPDVQFGCPASCDQPIPLCKAAIGPGCGCPKGTVIAGSSTRPRQPERCISPKRCAVPAPTCPTGEPLKGAFCGRGGSPCPAGFTCNIDPLDRFAVCCSDDVSPPPPKCVVTGCNSEVCTDNPDIATICVVPSCEVSCTIKFGTCQSDQNGVCGWDTSAAEKDYQHCLAGCEQQPGDY
jgi:hypothetical protein